MQVLDQPPAAALLTSEELRAKAISLALRRGQSVAKRRIAMRWVTWLLWSWVLPTIGLLTVLIAVSSMSLVFYFGPAKVIDGAQNWLVERFGAEGLSAKPDTKYLEKLQERSDNIGSKTLPDHNNVQTNADTVTNTASTVILQFDRNIKLQNSKATTPNNSSSSPHNEKSALLPKGTQP